MVRIVICIIKPLETVLQSLIETVSNKAHEL